MNLIWNSISSGVAEFSNLCSAPSGAALGAAVFGSSTYLEIQGKSHSCAETPEEPSGLLKSNKMYTALFPVALQPFPICGKRTVMISWPPLRTGHFPGLDRLCVLCITVINPRSCHNGEG